MLVKNLKVVGVVLGTLALYTWVSSAIPQIESAVPEELTFSGEVTQAELIAAGQELYEGAGQCGSCHDLGTQAPTLLKDHAGQGSIGQRCGGRVAGKDCKAYLHESLVQPASFLVEGFNPIMPDQSRTLSPTQIWAMVAYLQSVGGEVTVTSADLAQGDDGGEEPPPATPAPASASPAAAADVTDPLELLRANICLSCHQLGGEGVALGPPFDGIGSRRDADYIRRSILDPAAEASEGFEAFTAVMPRTFGQTLTAAQLEAVVQFLANQR